MEMTLYFFGWRSWYLALMSPGVLDIKFLEKTGVWKKKSGILLLWFCAS
jgi:hypothetical protein